MKRNSIFVCQKCDAQTPKWMGQCPECGSWGTLVEEIRVKSRNKSPRVRSEANIIKLSDVSEQREERIKTDIKELDQVLGGGIVLGSVVLFSGQPGIGKSTLLTQIAMRLATGKTGIKVVYVCGEESPSQVKLRVNRLKGKQLESDILLFPETDVDTIISRMEGIETKKENYLLIVDSIQTLFTSELEGVAGSIGQVRESTHRLIEFAKEKQIPVFLVGHVTKSGALAGPKTIEHAVDTVLYFEGERSADLRLLRSVKNRFGATDEVGVFQMTDKGLTEVADPSSLTLGEDLKAKIGSAYTVVFEGTRPMVAEIQALVTKSFSPVPKRIVNGLEKRRVEMLVAVIQKYLKLPLWQYDIFVNVSGGFRITEPAADLAICGAVFSSYKNKSLFDKSIFLGEVSLLGGVSPISKIEKREKQANALGFKKIFSSANLPRILQLKSLFKA